MSTPEAPRQIDAVMRPIDADARENESKAAGTAEMPLDELPAPGREHPSYLQPRVDAAQMGRRVGSRRRQPAKTAAVRGSGKKGGLSPSKVSHH